MPWLKDKQLKLIFLLVRNFFLSDVVIDLYLAHCHIGCRSLQVETLHYGK